MDAIDVIAQWQSLFCYHGADEDESDPYLWTIGVVFDGCRDDQDRALVPNRRGVARLGAAVVLLPISAPRLRPSASC